MTTGGSSRGSTPSIGPSADPTFPRQRWGSMCSGHSIGGSSIANVGRGGGSVTGGPWQLVEVSNATAQAVARSTPPSPIVPVLRSPSIRSLGDPTRSGRSHSPALKGTPRRLSVEKPRPARWSQMSERGEDWYTVSHGGGVSDGGEGDVGVRADVSTAVAGGSADAGDGRAGAYDGYGAAEGNEVWDGYQGGWARSWRRRPGGRRRRGGWWEGDGDGYNRRGGGGKGGRRWDAQEGDDGADDGNDAEAGVEAEAGGVEKDGFDPASFVGEWLDNLGHQIFVVPAGGASSIGGRGGRAKGGGGRPRVVYLATLHKLGVPAKNFHISRDRGKLDWTCGNGLLMREETTTDVVKWKAGDGRISSWKRQLPDGPVYFDPPAMPTAVEGPGAQCGGADGFGPMCFMLPDALQMPTDGGERQEHHEAFGFECEPAEAETEEASDAAANERAGALLADMTVGEAATAAATATPATSLSAAAPVFVPSVPEQPQISETADVVFVPEPPEPPKLQIEETADVQIVGGRLEWSLPDPWVKLFQYPKGFCITSPMFGVQGTKSMQLVFYPNGSRAADDGQCTVALTRTQGDGVGVKFEFEVNGRRSGPKACLGRRYLGDLPRPFDDSEEQQQGKVVVSMTLLEILPGE
eukprot:TRINITY_DN43547_c0_g1_i1.p1 TRINITY_DN43547_c0_g1~~TRINITY_DN43547_c0_g1_i1.p1  ORF type:complete len:657 (-),score=139.04 TRINITY_DN43547_c0_g1_i1:75-1985(-)